MLLVFLAHSRDAEMPKLSTVSDHVVTPKEKEGCPSEALPDLDSPPVSSPKTLDDNGVETRRFEDPLEFECRRGVTQRIRLDL